MPKLFEGAKKNWKYVAKATLAGIAFWLAQFAAQYFFLADGSFGISLIRSFAFTGATLTGLALIIGPLFRLYPKMNFIVHRRTLGVLGFSAIILHIVSVYNFVFTWNFAAVLADTNPFTNFVIFGMLAATIFFLLYITSTDWATQKLGFFHWKTLHRLIYIGYIFAVLHFELINPPVLKTPPGMLLMAVTVLAILLQLAGFAKTVLRDKKPVPIVVGAIIILFGAIMFWLAFFK